MEKNLTKKLQIATDVKKDSGKFWYKKRATNIFKNKQKISLKIIAYF